MIDTHQGACWEAEDAREILATEALEGKTAVFLATHFPIQDFELAGARASEIESPTAPVGHRHEHPAGPGPG